MFYHMRAWVLLLSSFFLAACGGGGGGGLAPGSGASTGGGFLGTAGTRETASELAQRPEYQRHLELQLIDALKPHAAGYRGAGAKIAIVDMPLARSRQLVDDRSKTLANPFYSDLQGVTEGGNEIAAPVVILDPEVPNPIPPSYTSGENVIRYENAYVEKMHGTIVAQIAGGRYQKLSSDSKGNTVGVAPEASISAFGIASCAGTGVPTAPWCREDNPLELRQRDAAGNFTHELTDANFANFIKSLTGAYDVVNFSFSFPGEITAYRADNYALLHQLFDDTMTQLEQLGRDSPGTRNTTAFVIAAGNSSTLARPVRNPELLPGLPVVRPSLKRHMIAVVATQPSDLNNPLSQQVIAEYSNRCGVSYDYCIAAPGLMKVYLPGPDQDPPIISEARGTSFAAPRVSGALAVLVGQATVNGKRQTTMEELVNRLLVTANNEGIYANQLVYGHGMLDLDAASRAVGSLSLATSNSLDGRSFSFSTSQLAAGPAFGDSLERAFGGRRVMLFDELDFPFQAPLSAVLNKDSVRRTEERALWSRLDWLGQEDVADGAESSWRVNGFSALRPHSMGGVHWFGAPGGTPDGLFPGGAADLGGHLGLLEMPLGIGHSWRSGNWGGRSAVLSTVKKGEAAVGLVSQLHPVRFGGHDLRWTAGVLHRNRYLLDTSGAGGFAAAGSVMGFMGLGGSYRLGERWWLRYGMALGHTRLRTISGAALRGGSPLLTTEGEIGVVGRSFLRDGDRIGLRLHQPLRVERGTMEVGYALYRTPDRFVVQETFTASLEPSGRQVDLEGVYRVPLADGMEAGLLLRWSRQPGHVRGAALGFDVLGALSLEF